MTYEEVEEYDRVVLNIENPQLKRYLVLNEALRKEHDTGIMHKLQKYVEDRKANFEANVPKPG